MHIRGAHALVCGAGGFIGGHLVNKLFDEGAASVRAVDVKPLDEWYQKNPEAESVVLDLQEKEACLQATMALMLSFNWPRIWAAWALSRTTKLCAC
jgi:GDP-D-mannose 3',5'-epimerase